MDVCLGGDDSVDNNHDGKPDCKYPPAYHKIIPSWKCGNGKVYICHKDKNSLCIAYTALAAHIAHGDYLGLCGNAACADELKVLQPGQPLASVNHFARYPEVEIHIYPNPVQQILYIKLPGNQGGPVQIQVFNSIGRQVKYQRVHLSEIGGSGIALQVQSLSDGIYFLKTSSAGFQKIKTFIKSK